MSAQFVPSPQQQALFNWVQSGTGNARVDAVAGAGKTTSLLEAIRYMRGNVFYGQFGKKNAKEVQAKALARGYNPSLIEVSTFHSAGLAALKAHLGPAGKRLRIEGKKMSILFAEMHPSLKSAPNPLEAFAIKSASMARQRGFGPIENLQSQKAWYDMIDHFGLDEMLPDIEGKFQESMIDDGIDMAIRLIERGAQQCDRIIDFDDMIWAPLHFKCRVFKRNWVLIDECQDTNPVRRALAAAMLDKNGRLIAVGDPAQAIFGFTGADNDAMDQIEQQFNCTRIPLTITYRCPKRVVAVAQRWVRLIKAAETAPEGSVRELGIKEFLKETFSPTDYIICRYNKPLVELCYSFLKRRIPCRIEGKDIGKSLIALTKKWKVRNLETLVDRLEIYLEKETKKLIEKGKETKADSLTDKVECVIVLCDSLIEEGKNKVEDLVALITSMFADSDEEPTKMLTLMTSHKAKGLETDRVYWLGPNQYNPSKMAVKDWQKVQEDNLMYVTVTRAMEELVIVSV